jgi:hypothetical protein
VFAAAQTNAADSGHICTQQFEHELRCSGFAAAAVLLLLLLLTLLAIALATVEAIVLPACGSTQSDRSVDQQ